MNYEMAKAAWQRATAEIKEAQAQRDQINRRRAELLVRIREEKAKTEDLRGQLKEALGTKKEDGIVRALNTAREVAAAAEEMLKDMPEPGSMLPYLDTLQGVTSDFLYAIARKEMEAFPQEALKVLYKAFEVRYGINPPANKWKEFLAEAVNMGLSDPTYADLQTANVEIRARHGIG